MRTKGERFSCVGSAPASSRRPADLQKEIAEGGRGLACLALRVAWQGGVRLLKPGRHCSRCRLAPVELRNLWHHRVEPGAFACDVTVGRLGHLTDPCTLR